MRNLAVRVIARAFDDACGLIECYERRKGNVPTLLFDGWRWLVEPTEDRKAWFKEAGLKEPKPELIQAMVDRWAELRIEHKPARKSNLMRAWGRALALEEEKASEDDPRMA